MGPREINNVCASSSSPTNGDNFGAYLIGLLWGLKEKLRAGGEGDDRRWDGWMASPTQWTWVWMNSRRWWWTGRSGVLQFTGSQRVRQDWATELNWTELNVCIAAPGPWEALYKCLLLSLLLFPGLNWILKDEKLNGWKKGQRDKTLK